MRCAACGQRIDVAPGERIGFHDTCTHCDADLHACRCCGFHDPAAYNACRESSAERVLDPERANRCEYFRPSAAVGEGAENDESGAGRVQALHDLEALFKK